MSIHDLLSTPCNSEKARFPRPVLIVTFFAAALLALGTVTAHAAEDRSFDRTLNVNDGLTLKVSTGSGNVHLHPGSGNQIHVVGHIHGGHSWMNFGDGDIDARIKKIADNPPIVQSGDQVTVGERNSTALFRNISIDYDITLPTQAAIDVSSGSGDVEIQDVGATLKANSGSGSIRARGIHGQANLETGSGNIELSETTPGDVKAQTGSGSIRLNGVSGGLKAETGSGDIEVSGDPKSDWKLDAGSGNIHLNLGAAKFNVNASTGSGSIQIQQSSVMKADSDKHDLRASVNGGGPMVKAETGSGDITIR